MKRFFSIILVFSIFHALAQNTYKIDSLQYRLLSAKEDTSAIGLLNELCREYQFYNTQIALEYAHKALVLAEKFGNRQKMADCYASIALVQQKKGNYAKALEHCFKATAIYEEEHASKKLAQGFDVIGRIYRAQGNYAMALEYHIKAIKIYEQIADKTRLAHALGETGKIYREQNNYEKALEYQLKSAAIASEIGDKKTEATAVTNIARTYREQGDNDRALEFQLRAAKIKSEIGDKEELGYTLDEIGKIYGEKGDFEKALEYHLKASAVEEEINDKNGLGYTFTNIGNIYRVQGKYEIALAYHLGAVKIREEIGNKKWLAYSLNEAGKTCLLLLQFDKALEYQNRGLQIALESNSKTIIRKLHEALSETYAQKGEPVMALKHYKKFSAYKDSVLSEESIKHMAEMATKYETEKKEQKITLLNKDNALQAEQLNKQKIINWSVGTGLALVLLFALILFNRFQLIRKQKSIIEHEKQRSEELLLNILPVETAAELKETGQATPKQYEKATVLFTDFKNFTKLAENMTPVELVSELDYCFKEFDKIITKYNIEKIKTIGDAYMCAGGLPRTNQTNPVDIVIAGLEIQQFMQQWKEEKTREGKPFWEIRLGVHTGPLIAGIVGVKKFAYDIWGDTVNTASRMESSGEPGKVNISGDTYEWVKDFFECSHRGKVEAKNKGKVDMYFVEGIKPEFSQNGAGVIPNERFEEMKKSHRMTILTPDD